MKHVVYKYIVPVNDEDVHIDIPLGAQFLHAYHQGHPDEVVMWWRILNPEAGFKTHIFRVVGTGHKFDSEYGWLATIPFAPSLVWHLLERET
jgi:hypothetical protein